MHNNLAAGIKNYYAKNTKKIKNPIRVSIFLSHKVVSVVYNFASQTITAADTFQYIILRKGFDV
jgi:hypothetical protein